MKNILKISLLSALIAHPAYAGPKEEIDLEDAPISVQKTLIKQAAGGEITEIEREKKKGKYIYEAEIELPDGTEIEVEVDHLGKVLDIDVESGPKDKDKPDDSKDDHKNDGRYRTIEKKYNPK